MKEESSSGPGGSERWPRGGPASHHRDRGPAAGSHCSLVTSVLQSDLHAPLERPSQSGKPHLRLLPASSGPPAPAVRLDLDSTRPRTRLQSPAWRLGRPRLVPASRASFPCGASSPALTLTRSDPHLLPRGVGPFPRSSHGRVSMARALVSPGNRPARPRRGQAVVGRGWPSPSASLGFGPRKSGHALSSWGTDHKCEIKWHRLRAPWYKTSLHAVWP